MFTSFSGSSRRPRQVNLSGRKANVFGSVGTGAGSQAALDRAQQERAQRQRERDTLKAAQVLQRVWRGHASRNTLANRLRAEWDAAESSTPQDTPYDSEEEAFGQIQRLLLFASSRDEADLRRIRHFAFRQLETVQQLNLTSSGPWPSTYLRLQRIILTILERQSSSAQPEQNLENEFISLLKFLSSQIPSETSQNALQFYQTLASVFSKTLISLDKNGGTSGLNQGLTTILETVVFPLQSVTGYTLNAYEAFGQLFLTLPFLTGDDALSKKIRDFLAEAINYKILANALSSLFKKTSITTMKPFQNTSDRLRLLGCFIYFHRFAHNFHAPEASSTHTDYVSVLSILLNSLPTNVVDGKNTSFDRSEDDGSTNRHGSKSRFLHHQISSLVNQEGIGSLLSGSSPAAGDSEDEKIDEARQLANYALALLRFFPRRGDEIRMWLHLGPSSRAGSSEKLPAIRYFWEATKRSSVFGTILKDSRAAIDFLKTKPEISYDRQTSRSTNKTFWQPAQQEVDRNASLADEWRVILVFLELYTFVLKVTDDEEFFSSINDARTSQSKDNSLALSDVKDLTTFLKNLGFTLYFNASDITAAEDRDSSSTGISYFNPKFTESQSPKQALEPSVGGVAGLSLDYVKGLATGLLRMVYERDSRRKFLPSNHWLMTSRFDMTGFIPAVVQEEEDRHKIEEEDADDVDDYEEEEEDDEGPQLIGTGRTQQQRRQERLVREQRKASKRRYLQAVAPRLEILQNMPFFIPFTTRVQIFREFVTLDMVKRRNGAADSESWRARAFLHHGQLEKHAGKIRRDYEFEDAFEQFYPLGQGLKEPISITFVDQFGAAEAGIDGGGVTKEFLTSVTNRAFTPSGFIDMFVENDQHLLYPNPSAVEEYKAALEQTGILEGSPEFRSQVSELLQRYEFLGRIIGKCMYEGILVDVNFAPFFLRKWALTGGAGSAPKETGYRPTLNDLRDLDEGLYQGLHRLKSYAGDVEELGLNFTVDDTFVVDHNTDPKKKTAVTRELKPGGANEAVTNQNRLVYISYMARHRLQNQPFQQTSAFLRGLSSMIQPSWLSMFNQSELQTLIGGTSSSIDLDDLRRNTIYGGTYVIGDDGLEHPTVQLFWKVLKDLSEGERAAVLKFVTSTPRAPLLGFSTLNPRFSIRDAGSDQERLPSTSTCVNLLKLPMYRDEDVLKEKLLYSVFSGAGFDLS